MARHLKRGIDASTKAEADARVRATVEAILKDIEARGDAAVRELLGPLSTSGRPPSFRLTREQIDACYAPNCRPSATSRTSASRRQQVRNFARDPEGASMRDVEVETLPGVVLGHKHIPVNSVGCYVPGGKLSARRERRT